MCPIEYYGTYYNDMEYYGRKTNNIKYYYGNNTIILLYIMVILPKYK